MARSAGDPTSQDSNVTPLSPCPHANRYPVDGWHIVLDPDVHQRQEAAGQRVIYRVTMCRDCGVLQGVFDHAEVG